MQYAMVIDLNKCIGCHSCTVACRAEWQVPPSFQRSRLDRIGPHDTPFGLASTFFFGRCNHCDKPACVPVCPVPPKDKVYRHEATGLNMTVAAAATWKDPFNGIVNIDKKRCIGCGLCVQACPYKARFLNDKLKKPKADKCSFCIELIDQGKQPACVDTCITDAITIGDIDNPESIVSGLVRNGAIRLESEAVRIGPNVFYLGKQKDIYLITEKHTPQKLPQASQRRIVLAGLIKPAQKVTLPTL